MLQNIWLTENMALFLRTLKDNIGYMERVILEMARWSHLHRINGLIMRHTRESTNELVPQRGWYTPNDCWNYRKYCLSSGRSWFDRIFTERYDDPPRSWQNNSRIFISIFTCSYSADPCIKKGSGQNSIALSDLRKMPILLPPLEAQKLYSDKSVPFYHRIEIVRRENQELQKMYHLLIDILIFDWNWKY